MRLKAQKPPNLIMRPSFTRKLFTIGFAGCLLKLMLSGLVIGEVSFGVFSGVDFGAAIGALGSIYVARQHSQAMTASPQEKL